MMMTSESPRGAARIPWYLWVFAIAVTCAMVGIQWDISWHRSIGRDAFLTPAHIAIYLCGILAGLGSAYLIFSSTFTRSSLRDASIRVWGFRAPLGAFVAAWGGVVMLASAPFDDWWHAAYGLDVKILSPPHVVLALGIFAIEAGAVLLVAGRRNGADAAAKGPLDALFLYVGGAGLCLSMSVTMEYTWVVMQHSALFYQAVAITTPFLFALVSRGSAHKWACTAAAAVYTALMLGLVWVLPLFPASPKLGPVYRQVTHFVAPGFPLLVIVPALALDLLWARTGSWGPWKKALTAGPLFVAVFLAVQWPFATFLQSTAAENWFFASHDLDYRTSPASLQALRQFWQGDASVGAFWTSLALATVFAIVGTRLGLARGKAIGTIRR